MTRHCFWQHEWEIIAATRLESWITDMSGKRIGDKGRPITQVTYLCQCKKVQQKSLKGWVDTEIMAHK